MRADTAKRLGYGVYVCVRVGVRMDVVDVVDVV